MFRTLSGTEASNSSDLGVEEETSLNNEEQTTEEVDETQVETTEEVENSEQVENDTPEEESEETIKTQLETMKKELATWQNRYKNAESLIGRHSNELNQLRQFYAQHSQKVDSKQNEDSGEFLENFVKNPKQALEAELNRRNEALLQQQMQHRTIVENNIQSVKQAIPNYVELADTVLEIAKQDGIASPTYEMFEQTVANDPLLAIQYLRRAQMQVELQQFKNKSKETIKKISNNSLKPKNIKSSAPQKSEEQFTNDDIAAMSDEEIKAYLKKHSV